MTKIKIQNGFYRLYISRSELTITFVLRSIFEFVGQLIDQPVQPQNQLHCYGYEVELTDWTRMNL